MSWSQITLTVDKHDVEAINAYCDLLGALSVTLTDHGDEPLYGQVLGEHPVWSLTDVIALFDAGQDMAPILHYFTGLTGVNNITVEKIEDQDWVRKSRESFQPIQFTENVWVCPSWTTPPDPDAYNVMIDPGLAFGTGTHETTSLCLGYLASCDLAGKVVIDYGCGSGILGLAALTLGAAEVWAIDNDPQAVLASKQNQALNPEIADRFHVGLPHELPDMQADIVVANILAGPLITLAPTLGNITKKGGLLALSGILADQVDAIRSVYEQSLVFQTVKDDSGWILAIFEKNA